MNKNQVLERITLIIFATIIVLLSVYIFILKFSTKSDKDYKKLGIELEPYNISHYTIYEEKDTTGQYKVYKLNISNKKEEIIQKIENSEYWSKNKFYEYIMQRFYEIVNDERTPISRENVYYYHKKDVYSILNLESSKLYYFENNVWNYHKEYDSLLGIKTKEYSSREIYSVRGGPQNDGLDYYVYSFTEETGQKIVTLLDKSSNWRKEKLEEKILSCFTYNNEVLSIINGYYYYKLVCRTNDPNKKKHITKETATGFEIGIFDTDKNTLYYYWTSI